MQIDSAAECDSASRQNQDPCPALAELKASIQTAAMHVASSNPMTPVGQRINSRQATASRVSFDDPLDDEMEISQKQSIPMDLQVAPTPSSPAQTASDLAESFSAAPENP